MLLMMLVFVALLWGLMWAADRWLHRFAAIAIGASAIGWLSQNIVRGIAHCNAPPEFIPSLPGEGGEGRMVFNCDSAGGAIDRIYLYILGPACIALIGYLVIRIGFRDHIKSDQIRKTA